MPLSLADTSFDEELVGEGATQPPQSLVRTQYGRSTCAVYLPGRPRLRQRVVRAVLEDPLVDGGMVGALERTFHRSLVTDANNGKSIQARTRHYLAGGGKWLG
jgi:hypothetical protein